MPGLKHNRAHVLRTRRVLWKQARPVLGVRIHADATGARDPPDFVGENAGHSRLAFINDGGISHIQGDPQTIEIAAMARQAPIAEVEPEKVRILFFRNPSHAFAGAVTVRGFLSPSDDDVDPGRGSSLAAWLAVLRSAGRPRLAIARSPRAVPPLERRPPTSSPSHDNRTYVRSQG